MVRVILDTNVLINGVQDEYSFAYRIIQLCLDGTLQPLVSTAIMREYAYKADELITDATYFETLDDFYERVEEVTVRSHIRVVEDDPDDNKFFACAKDGKADFIITNDAHLLDFGSYEETKVVTPEEFLNIFHQEYDEEGAEWKEWIHSIGL